MSKEKKRQVEDMPQWVRDFIVQRQRELLDGKHLEWLQTEAAKSDKTYLLCPLSDNQVEVIRAGAYQFREKTLRKQQKKAALRKQEREDCIRLRQKGKLLPVSGISCHDDFKELNEFKERYTDPLLYTQFVRRDFYCPLDRHRMEHSLGRYFGWEKWSEDPWGSYPKFWEWIATSRDNEMAVWAVNGTSMGRSYLVRGILEGLGQLDYSAMTEKDLLSQIGYGAAAFLYVKSYTAGMILPLTTHMNLSR